VIHRTQQLEWPLLEDYVIEYPEFPLIKPMFLDPSLLAIVIGIKVKKQNNNSRGVQEVKEDQEEEVKEEVRIFQDQKNQLTQPTPEVSDRVFGSG